VVRAEVVQEPLPSAGAQVQREHRRSGGSRGGNLCQQGIDLLIAVCDHRQYRRDEHLAREICLDDGVNQVEPGARRRRARLECRMDVLVEERDGYPHADRYRTIRHG
jgi:hypothetical protein